MSKDKSKEEDVKEELEVKAPKAKTPGEEFNKKIAELKKKKSETELLEIVSVQPANHELRDFMAARKALDELGIKYSKSFK